MENFVPNNKGFGKLMIHVKHCIAFCSVVLCYAMEAKLNRYLLHATIISYLKLDQRIEVKYAVFCLFCSQFGCGLTDRIAHVPYCYENI